MVIGRLRPIELTCRMPIDKAILGIAGEFAVASELCRRNVYAQLTLGNQKRTDLLVYRDDKYVRIEVKAKQGREWPNCRGVTGDAFIVFVDFAGRGETERPDFYLLTADDWHSIMILKRDAYHARHEDRHAEIIDNCLVFHSEVNRHGKPYRGCGVTPKDLQKHLERWDRVCGALA